MGTPVQIDLYGATGDYVRFAEVGIHWHWKLQHDPRDSETVVLPADFSKPLFWLSGAICCLVWQVANLSTAVTLDAVNRGYFRSDGRHFTANDNTFSGYASSRRYNSFFVFDLASLAGTVDSANLGTVPPKQHARA